MLTRLTGFFKNKKNDMILLIVLFLALRIAGLLLLHPAYNSRCPIEEYYRGAIAKEILQGTALPYWQYQADYFGGGSLVMGALTSPFFKVFGESAFVLRLVSVLISLAALLIWFGILKREYSRKCAWYFSLFFIFAPPAFRYYSMIPLGDHYETIFFSALGTAFFLKAQREAKPTLTFFLLGVLSGFGIWFAYIFALSVATWILLWFRRNRTCFLTPAFWAFLSGFGAGFIPWIIANVQNRFRGLWIQGLPFWEHLQIHSYAFKTWFIHDVIEVFKQPLVGWQAPEGLVPTLYAIMLGVPWILLLILKRLTPFESRETPAQNSNVADYFKIYTVLHLMAIQWTDFEGVRYMMPLVPAILFFWARTIERLEQISEKLMKPVRLFFAFPLFGLSTGLWLSMISWPHAGLLLRTKGYVYDYLVNAPVCYENFENCTEAHQKIMNHASEEEQRKLWVSLVYRLAESTGPRDPETALSKLKVQDPVVRSAYYFHYGWFLFFDQNQNLKASILLLKSLIPEHTPGFRLAQMGLFRAFGSSSIYENVNVLTKVNHELVEDGAMVEHYFKAIGEQSVRYWGKNADMEDIYHRISYALPRETLPKERTAFFQGLGNYFVKNTYDDPALAYQHFQDVKKYFAPEDQRDLYRGIGRSYEISRLFSPASCKSWSYEYLHEERDLSISSWILEGRKEVITKVEKMGLTQMKKETTEMTSKALA